MSRVSSPLIAVNGLVAGDAGEDLRLANRYAESVLKAGGVPLVIPPVGGPADLRRLLETVDGLLLTGGDDFDMPRLGLGATHPAASPTPASKQDFDVELARAALELEMPVLGICYGMQLLALVEGADLHQHLPEDRPGSQQHSGNVLHPVQVQAGSKLRAVLDVEHLQVTSRHHQAVSSLGGPWTVAARDEEGLIEGIERADHPFALGVQWHPELAPEGSPHGRLFSALVHAAGQRAQHHAAQPALRV